MVKKAFFRACIPFSTDKITDSENFVLPEGWQIIDIHGDSLLKHINTAFDENVVSFAKTFENLSFSCTQNEEEFNFSVSEIQVFCFDTGIGIVSFHIPYDEGLDEHTLVNTCAVLRCSAKHDKAVMGRTISADGCETYLSCLAEEQLSELLGDTFTLFNHSNENSMKRVDMFSAVLCDTEPENGDCDAFYKLCHRLSNAIDDRDKDLVTDKSTFYEPQDYTKWSFSNRGSAVVSNLTGTPSTDNFLNDRWLTSVRTNYFCLYLMILHQKYAIYNYLNTVAADKNKLFFKNNQESLIDFNSKYVFAIVSDEQFIQNAYTRMKKANNIDEVYTDLLDELQRLFDYSRLKTEESNEVRNSKLNIISVIISVLCSVSIIFDTVNMFSELGTVIGFSSPESIVYTSVVALEVLLFIASILFVFYINKKRK